MIINYLNEAGPFGSYKKATAQSNLANVKRELHREATNHILDKFAELFLDMMDEVNSQTTTISSKYHYTPDQRPRIEEQSRLVELTNYVASKLYKRKYNMPVKEMKLNLIKNVYCNKQAIEFMLSHGCFILPLVDAERHLNQTFFNNAEEIPSYKNMTKTVAAAAEKVIKSHLSKFPNYNYTIIPNTVKIIILQDESLVKYESMQEQQLLSYMGVTNSGVEFEYPGKGSACLDYIVDTCSLFTTYFSIKLTKSYEHIFKEMENPSPWMLNKFAFRYVFTKISTLIADNFYGIKLLKSALNNNILLSPISITITIDNVLKNMPYINKLKQEVSNNGLDHLVKYHFDDNNAEVDSLIMIGEELSAEQAEQEGIDIDDLKRRVYEFDYNNSVEVKYASKDIINGCSRFLTNTKIKKIAEDEMEKYLPSLMRKVLAARPDCVSSSNKALLCEYNSKTLENTNIRVVINQRETEINKNGNLEFYIAIDFKLPVRGVSSKYKDARQNHRKKYAFITGNKIKIEIPL